MEITSLPTVTREDGKNPNGENNVFLHFYRLNLVKGLFCKCRDPPALKIFEALKKIKPGDHGSNFAGTKLETPIKKVSFFWFVFLDKHKNEQT